MRPVSRKDLTGLPLDVAGIQKTDQDVKVIRVSNLVTRLSLALIIFAPIVTLTIASDAGSSMNPPPIPLMVVRINDSKTVYVVSTDNLFD